MKRDMQYSHYEDAVEEMSESVTVVQPKEAPVRPLRPHDPSNLGYPATLPIEVALKTDTIQKICEAYGLTREQWKVLCLDKSFQEDYKTAQGLIAEGFGFKLKAE